MVVYRRRSVSMTKQMEHSHRRAEEWAMRRSRALATGLLCWPGLPRLALPHASLLTTHPGGASVGGRAQSAPRLPVSDAEAAASWHRRSRVGSLWD